MNPYPESRHPEGRHITAPIAEELRSQGFPPEQAARLADVILELLSRTHGGQDLRIPNRPRNRALRDAVKFLRGSMSAEDVGDLMGYSRRTVERIVAKAITRKVA